MLADFYPYELDNVLTITTTALFFPISIFGSYAILFKTPPTIRVFKFPFFYLNSSYQIAIFCVGALSRIEVTFLPESLCFNFSGIVLSFGRLTVYFEIFFIACGLLGVVNSIFLCFLCRYFQVCHPKSFFSVDPFWQRVVNIGILSSITIGTAVLYVISVILFRQEPPIPQEDHIAICFSYYINTFLTMVLCYSGGSLFCGYIFMCRVLWSMKSQVSNASKRTREMMKMLTITLVVSAMIPTVLGGGPMLAAAYSVITKVDHAEVLFRLIFLTCIWQGLLSISATIFLVKPYRKTLLKWLRLRKGKTTITVTST